MGEPLARRWAACPVVLALALWVAACRSDGPARSASSESRPPPTTFALPELVNYAEHVAPILHNHCASCHRLGEAGRFPLLSYQDAASRAALIKAVTETRYMPPWPADPRYRHFAGENVLTDEQIALLGRWVDQGAARGDPHREPRPPRFPKGSQLGKPDLVVRMPGRYTIRGDNTDKFVSMKLPFSLPLDTFARAIEFVPGNRTLVHHVNAHLVTYAGRGPKRLLQGPWFSEAGEHNMDPLGELGLGDRDSLGQSLTLSVTN